MKIDIHFSLIAAAVTYIMWQSVGEDKIKKMEGKRLDDDESSKKRKGYWRVDCQSASKGLFLGKVTLEMKKKSSLKVTFLLSQYVKINHNFKIYQALEICGNF